MTVFIPFKEDFQIIMDEFSVNEFTDYCSHDEEAIEDMTQCWIVIFNNEDYFFRMHKSFNVPEFLKGLSYKTKYHERYYFKDYDIDL